MCESIIIEEMGVHSYTLERGVWGERGGARGEWGGAGTSGEGHIEEGWCHSEIVVINGREESRYWGGAMIKRHSVLYMVECCEARRKLENKG